MKKITTKCAFCGRETNYFFHELNCYICPFCLGEYRSALIKNNWQFYDDYSTHPMRNNWQFHDSYSGYPWIHDGYHPNNEIKIDSVDERSDFKEKGNRDIKR